MVEIRWTLQAANDLESVTDFIANDSEFYAQLFATDVIEAIDRLSLFPQSGRIVPEANNPVIREIILGNYRLVYRSLQDAIEVLTIYHGARLLDPTKLF